MFNIRLYQTESGAQPIKTYLSELFAKADKDSRIRQANIDRCFEALRQFGTRIGEPTVKHIEGVIWELRPTTDRFFFFATTGNCFVMLHHYVKKSQKAPRREIDQAKRNLADYLRRDEGGRK